MATNEDPDSVSPVETNGSTHKSRSKSFSLRRKNRGSKKDNCEIFQSSPEVTSPVELNGYRNSRTHFPNTNRDGLEMNSFNTDGPVSKTYDTQLSSVSSQNPQSLFINFDHNEEQVYKSYFRRQRLGVLPTILAISLVHAIGSLVLDLVSRGRDDNLDRMLVICLTSVLAAGACIVVLYSSLKETITEVLAVIMWLLLTFQIFYDIGTAYPRHTPTDRIGWLVVLIYFTQLTLPLGAWQGLPICLSLVALHSVLAGIFWHENSEHLSHLENQLAANIMLCIASTCIGLAGCLYMDRLNRRSVIETKAAVSAKAKIEMAYKDKERLLLSVLPKNIADEMLQDVGNIAAGQFRKIYMSRYENVSILFADIVGFTAISSTVTAAELVKILNELFASFDVLARKFHQVRIKILGDCYYCVCGALKPRPDHAVLSIHMGLSMVDAISSVRQKTGKDVNMRVGVHTGACLGGVLGQRQWQFDVLGKEVTIANKMESGGLPARVHVSEVTTQFLNGEFELEPGNGAEREEELKLRNMTTYFVKSILKPYPEGTLDKVKRNGAPGKPVRNSLTGAPLKNGKTRNGGNHHSNGGVHPSTNDHERDNCDSCTDDDNDGDDDDDNGRNDGAKDSLSGEDQKKEFTKRLAQELKAREKGGDARKMTRCFMTFKDKGLEQRYLQRVENYSGLPFVALVVALSLDFVAKLCILPRTPLSISLYVVGVLMLAAMSAASMAATFTNRFPSSVVRFAHAIESKYLLKSLWGISACLVFLIVDTVPVVECSNHAINTTQISEISVNSSQCHYIVYYSHSACLGLIAVSSLVNISHMIKMALIVMATCLHSLIYLLFMRGAVDNYDAIVYQGYTEYPHVAWSITCQVIAITIALEFCNAQMEFTTRKLYLWKEESKREKEKVLELQRKNEALVYNLLPTHVAKDFLGRRKNHKELYSNAYDEVGVMFAACPNFHAFYNESAVNNNGLECLRFLNEIISDYDELLNQSRFSNIVKIKTVGATYMAASGMVQQGSASVGTSTKDRWGHLHDLVQFAFAMQDVIRKINEQSFNNFVLRIGINHGPIIAGVIGARKPHYDVWGNTVNVSSRMESTGQAGKIQVVEETKFVLEEFGYIFEKRGLVKVKGKGELMTYFLERRSDQNTMVIPNQVPGT